MKPVKLLADYAPPPDLLDKARRCPAVEVVDRLGPVPVGESFIQWDGSMWDVRYVDRFKRLRYRGRWASLNRAIFEARK